MTYNFDPNRWYENERSALEVTRKIENWSAENYEKALEALENRYDEMVRRLDGTYQIPKLRGMARPDGFQPTPPTEQQTFRSAMEVLIKGLKLSEHRLVNLP